MTQNTPPLAALSPDTAVHRVRQHGGYGLLTDWGLVEVTGPDAGTFLQTQTTHDVLSLAVGQGHLCALLDRKAHLDAVLSLHRVSEDTYWLLAEKTQIPGLLERLERYHFSEKLTMSDISERFDFFTLQGPEAWRLLKSLSPTLGLSPEEYALRPLPHDFETPITLIKRSLTGEDGYFLLLPAHQRPAIEAWIQSHPLAQNWAPLSSEVRNILRVEAGIPVFGIDMDTETILPATGLQQSAVSYTKGCYLGQEVVAKVKTYGSVQKALVGLVFSELTIPPQSQTDCLLAGTVIGTLRSTVFSPTLNAAIGLAYLNREYRVPRKQLTLTLADQTVSATVVLLPFYTATGASDRAQAQYEEALKAFAEDRETEAITLLREAIDLNPHLADAYESLGVILSRHEQYEEAIALMEQLATLQPEAVMPHTNLSVFYMKLGMKEEAEVEKALATTLGFKQAMANKMQQQSSEQAEQQRRAALEEKIGMFQEVLELDAEDTLAHYGLGNTYLGLARYAEARPHLEQALAHDPRYTVAYLALGKTLEGLGDTPAARDTYTRGIEVASQRGDLMPLKEMESRRAQL